MVTDPFTLCAFRGLLSFGVPSSYSVGCTTVVLPCALWRRRACRFPACAPPCRTTCSPRPLPRRWAAATASAPPARPLRSCLLCCCRGARKRPAEARHRLHPHLHAAGLRVATSRTARMPRCSANGAQISSGSLSNGEEASSHGDGDVGAPRQLSTFQALLEPTKAAAASRRPAFPRPSRTTPRRTRPAETLMARAP